MLGEAMERNEVNYSQPHQVAGSYVAAPKFEPALHLKGSELEGG